MGAKWTGEFTDEKGIKINHEKHGATIAQP